MPFSLHPAANLYPKPKRPTGPERLGGASNLSPVVGGVLGLVARRRATAGYPSYSYISTKAQADRDFLRGSKISNLSTVANFGCDDTGCTVDESINGQALPLKEDGELIAKSNASSSI